MNQKEFIKMIREENERLGRSYKLLMLRIGVMDYLHKQNKRNNIPEALIELAISELLERSITYNTEIRFPCRENDEKQKNINDNEICMAFSKAERILKNSNITIF